MFPTDLIIAVTILAVLALAGMTVAARVSAVVLSAVLLFAIPAAAADTTQLFGIDLSPIVDLVIQSLAVAVLAIGTWAINWVARKFKLSADSEVRKTLQEALANGVNFGANKLREAGAGLSTVETRYKIVAEAANYVSKRTPDALAYFKISPEGLHDLITARLPPVDDAPATGT